MESAKEVPTLCGKVIFAPEGFLDQRYLPLLKNSDLRIIEVRVLADGPVFHTVHRHLAHS